MKIFLSSLLSFCLLTTLLFGQSTDRTEGIVLTVATLGDVTETRRQIIQNTLIESLSSYYRLVPQDKLEEVQEKIFQEMDYDECTEDQCIIMIQEALQVENLFVLQVIGEGNDTQLSLKWVGLDDKKVKTDICKGCGTFELNERVEGLVRNLELLIPRGGNFVAETVDEERLKREREEELRKQREEQLKKESEKLKIQNKQKQNKKEVGLSPTLFKSLQIRFLIGTRRSEGTRVNNSSIHLNYKEFGLGFSQYNQLTKSNSDKEYELNNSTLDFSYSSFRDLPLTAGLGIVVGGDATETNNSSGEIYPSSNVSGTSIFIIYSIDFNNFEALIGTLFYDYRFSGFGTQSSVSEYSTNGMEIIFGIGI